MFEASGAWLATFDFADFSRVVIMSLVLWGLRVALLKGLVALGRSSYAESFRITKRPLINEKQLERESVWPMGHGIDVIATILIYFVGLFRHMEIVGTGFWTTALWYLALHAIVVEFLYYWWHRILHVQWVYKRWHQYHHKSINTEPTTALSFEIGERISYTLLFAIPPVVASYYGHQCMLSFALYNLVFDLMNEGGHINFEVCPAWLLHSPLKYIVYSPSYHAIHHTKFKKNYSLFMPWPDMIFGSAVWPLLGGHEEAVLPTSNQEL